MTESVIMGVDPGTNLLGYSVIRVEDGRVDCLCLETMDLRKVGDGYAKLGVIYENILKIVDLYLPDVMAIEAPFFGKNIQSMLKLGRAQGVVMAAAMARTIPVVEYAPKEVKMRTTGSGDASKELVLEYIRRQVFGDINPETLDASDALSIALCHYYKSKGNMLKTLIDKTSNENKENSLKTLNKVGSAKAKTAESTIKEVKVKKNKEISWEEFATKNPNRVIK